MIKIIPFFILLLIYTQVLISQNIKVTYDYTAVSGYLKHEPILLVTEKRSQFYVDYSDKTIDYKGSKLDITGQTYIVNYEYSNKKFTELRYLDNYEVKASWKNDQEWQILDETKTILGYNVRKAQIKKRNQIMYVWFTNEIPVKTGPFKNAGLPGLILEFYYSKQNTTCIATNIEFDVNESLKDFSNAFEISKKELRNLENNKKAIKKRIRQAN